MTGEHELFADEEGFGDGDFVSEADDGECPGCGADLDANQKHTDDCEMAGSDNDDFDDNDDE